MIYTSLLGLTEASAVSRRDSGQKTSTLDKFKSVSNDPLSHKTLSRFYNPKKEKKKNYEKIFPKHVHCLSTFNK